MSTKTELKKRQAIPLFLMGKTESQVAEAIGVSRQTIWKWKRHEDFNHEIAEAGEQLLAEHTVAVSELVERSITAMFELLGSANDSVKLKVAMTVLNSAAQWQRPAAPGHDAAAKALMEDQLQAMSQLNQWQDQFAKQGGKPEDFTMCLLNGEFKINGNPGTQVEEKQSSEAHESVGTA